MTTAHQQQLAEIYDHLAVVNPDARIPDGFEGAFLGIAHGFGREPAAAYDWAKCVRILMDRGMNEEEAEEWMDYNVLGAGGAGTMPVFVRLERDDDDGTPADGTHG